MTKAKRDAKIVEMVRQGEMSLREIGAVFGLSYEMVRLVAKAAGIVRGSGKNPLTETEKSEARRLYAAGMIPQHIARVIGRDPTTIRGYLCRIGLHVTYDDDTPWSDAEADLVRRQYHKIPASIIAKKLGRNRNEVIGKARRLGLSRPSAPAAAPVPELEARELQAA